MSEENSIEERVKKIVVSNLRVNADQITPDAKFIDDLGADSLDTVELMMAVDDEFDCQIPDEDAEKLTTVGDVIRYIEEGSSSIEEGGSSSLGRGGAGRSR